MRRHSLKRISLSILGLILAIFAPQPALADGDPPSRVARLSYTQGAVSFQPAGTDDWVSTVVNRPVTTGDKMWADQDSRAELHIGSASIRVSSNTGFSFLNLTDNVAQLQLTAGTLRVRVKRLDENETFEIDTPNLAFSVLRPGVYKVEVNEAGDTTIIKVRGGEGEITGGGSAFALRALEVGFFSGTDQLTADIESYQNDDDEFDVWCANRDRHEDLSISARYVSPDVIGYQDLDDYGAWRPVPGYGTVWFPQADTVGWAPYRYGHWAYVSPWGYTWIDDEPWGFAPFHYGRWIHYRGRWGWVPCPPPAPGSAYVRPVYAPALVAWVGGPHFTAIGVGGANVGWFPLGPREVYVPSYTVSRTYVNNVNVSNTAVNTTVINNFYNTTVVNTNNTVNNNVTMVHQTYVNQTVADAITATTPQVFTSAQSVSKNVVRVDVREVEKAGVNVFAPPVMPVKQAVLGSGAVTVAKPPAVLETRAVVAKVPPPPPPVAFAKQQQAIKENGGRPPAISQVRQMQPQTVRAARPEVKIAPPPEPGTLHEMAQPLGRPEPKGDLGNKTMTPTTSSPGSSAGHTPENANRTGMPVNAGPPVTGNRPGSAPTDTGNANPNRKGFEDRPPSAGSTARSSGNSMPHAPQGVNRIGMPVNSGQPVTGNRPGSAPSDTGNANANRKGFEDRPLSAVSTPHSSGNSMAHAPQDVNRIGMPVNSGQPVTGNRLGSAPTDAGNANANRNGFEERPPAIAPGNSNSGAVNNKPTNANMLDVNQHRQQQLQMQQQTPTTQQRQEVQTRQMPTTQPHQQERPQQQVSNVQQQKQQQQKQPDKSSKAGKDDHEH